MLPSKYTQKRTPSPPREKEDEEVKVKQPESAPAEAEPMQQGRPYQTFVESKAREYWQSLGGVGSLTKPTQQEIREAALPILCVARRRRTCIIPKTIAHSAVADVVQHAREQGWTKRPLSEAYASPSYVDALIQLARDADWLGGEIPLPDQPPIHYTRDTRTNEPVPKKDDFICGEYLSHLYDFNRFANRRIYPWDASQSSRDPNVWTLFHMPLLDTCYTLAGTEKPSVIIHYLEPLPPYYINRHPLTAPCQLHSEPLENLRAASMEIAALKASNQSEQEIETAIKRIRARYHLLPF